MHRHFLGPTFAFAAHLSKSLECTVHGRPPCLQLLPLWSPLNLTNSRISSHHLFPPLSPASPNSQKTPLFLPRSLIPSLQTSLIKPITHISYLSSPQFLHINPFASVLPRSFTRLSPNSQKHSSQSLSYTRRFSNYFCLHFLCRGQFLPVRQTATSD